MSETRPGPTPPVAFAGSIPEVYERCLGPMLFEPFAQDLAGRFAGFEGRLLETAAGTGRLTRALAQALEPQARITATDLSEPMLAEAAARLPDPRVAWQAADAQALPFEDESFAAVVCQFGVMFFPDKAAAYAEARRVLKPGGRFVFSVWSDLAANDFTHAVTEVLAEAFPADPPDFLTRVVNGYHDEAVIGEALIAAGFSEAGFEIVTLPTPVASAQAAAFGLTHGSPLRPDLEARGRLAEVEAAVAARIRARFGDPPAGRGRALLTTATV
ncbi:MAG: methyltransferase domain-containing protein [Caulobacterales bacterium]|nr:methyltransferase domain-containing protein [Caulobacterales bacterium]